MHLAERDGHRARERRPLANGSLSIAFVKDPTDKVWAKDRDRQALPVDPREVRLRRKAEDVYNFYGMGVAFTMVDALKRAGKNPTRASLLQAATHLNEVNPFMRPGIKIVTSPPDYYPISKAQLVRYDRAHWVAGRAARLRAADLTKSLHSRRLAPTGNGETRLTQPPGSIDVRLYLSQSKKEGARMRKSIRAALLRRRRALDAGVRELCVRCVHVTQARRRQPTPQAAGAAVRYASAPSVANADDPTARVAIYIPAGYQLATPAPRGPSSAT